MTARSVGDASLATHCERLTKLVKAAIDFADAIEAGAHRKEKP